MSDTPTPPEENQPEIPAEDLSAASPPELAGEEIEQSLDKNVCPNCGYANSLTRATCKNCNRPLPKVNKPEEPEPAVGTKRIQFAAGLIAWFLINGLWWVTQTAKTGFSGNEGVMICNGAFVFPINVLATILFAVKRRYRWIAYGILCAWALNLLASLFYGTVGNAVCLMPFFMK